MTKLINKPNLMNIKPKKLQGINDRLPKFGKGEVKDDKKTSRK